MSEYSIYTFILMKKTDAFVEQLCLNLSKKDFGNKDKSNVYMAILNYIYYHYVYVLGVGVGVGDGHNRVCTRVFT